MQLLHIFRVSHPEGIATHSSLVWRIPWTEEPGKLQSMGCKESDMTEHAHMSQPQLRPLGRLMVLIHLIVMKLVEEETFPFNLCCGLFLFFFFYFSFYIRV